MSATLGLDDSAYRQGVEEAKSQTKAAVSTMMKDYNRLYSEVIHLTAAYQKSRKETGETSKETKEFAKKLKEAQAQLNTTAQGLRTAEGYMSSFGEAASGSGKSLASAIAQGTIMAGMFSKLSSAALAAAKDFISSGIEYNAQIEKYTTGFTNMLGSAEAAQQVMSQIQEDAAKTPFDVESLTKANQYLISAGENATYARNTIMALGDAVSATGGGSDELNRMAQNLQQIANTGKATAVDIKQFAYAGINVYGILADYTGKSTAEVQNMTISYDLLTQAFQAASEEGGRYYNAMSDLSQTQNGINNTLKDNVKQLAGLLTGDLSGGIGVVESNLNQMTVAAIEAYKTDGWKGLGNAILDLDNPISAIIKKFGQLGSAAVSALDKASYYLNKALGKDATADYDTYEEYADAKLRQSNRDRLRQQALAGVGISNKSWSERQAEAAAASGNGSSSITTSPTSSTTKKKKSAGSKTETVIASTSHTITAQTANDLGMVTTSIQTLQEKVKDASGKIKDRVTETTTETGKEMVNGVETTYKQVVTKVDGVVTKTTKTYDDMSKSLLTTLTKNAQQTVAGITTAVQRVTEKYADGSEHVKETQTETGERIVDGVKQTYTKVTTYVDGFVTDVKESAQEVEQTVKATQERIEGYISGIQTQSSKGIFALAKSTVSNLKNKDWSGVAENVAQLIFGEVSQGQRESITEWAEDAMAIINEKYASGGVKNALQAISDLFRHGITPAANESSKAVRSFADVIAELGKSGGVGAQLASGAEKLLNLLTGTGTAMGTAATNAGLSLTGTAANLSGVLGSVTAGMAALFSKAGALIMANPEVAAIAAIGIGITGLGAAIWALYGRAKKKAESSASTSNGLSYKDLQDAYWYGNERAFAGYDYRTDPYTFNPNNSAVLAYQAKMQAAMEKLYGVVEQYLPDVANQQIVLDDGTLVGKMAPGMDVQLGKQAELAERGN